MSMVGTVIYDEKGNPTFLAPRGGSEALFNTLLSGGTAKNLSLQRQQRVPQTLGQRVYARS